VDQFKHKGASIEVKSDGHFYIDGDNRPYATLSDAKAEADEAHAVAVKAEHQGLALEVIDGQGTPHTIRGLNRSDSSLLGTPRQTDMYYPSESVTSILNVRAALSKRLSAIDTALSSVRIKASYGYGRLDFIDYGDAVMRLTESYQAAALASDDLIQFVP
jgi:hypothetical protein